MAMRKVRHLAAITTLPMIGAILFGPSLAIGQNAPVGCWEVLKEAKTINKIDTCQGNKICATVAAERVDGEPPTHDDLGKRVFEGATKDGANPKLWKGKIYVFKFKVDADMDLKVEGNTGLDVKGCASGFCASRKWKKVNCP
jgi:uncharacterized protein (DUF2147 family)